MTLAAKTSSSCSALIGNSLGLLNGSEVPQSDLAYFTAQKGITLK